MELVDELRGLALLESGKPTSAESAPREDDINSDADNEENIPLFRLLSPHDDVERRVAGDAGVDGGGIGNAVGDSGYPLDPPCISL